MKAEEHSTSYDMSKINIYRPTMCLNRKNKEKSLLENCLRRASVMLALVLMSLLPVACDQKPDSDRDYVAEHIAYMEEVISVKANMASILQGVKDQASADAVSPEVVKLRSRLEKIDRLDAALSREMGRPLWKECEAFDKDNYPRAKKAHEDVLRRIFYLKQEGYYGSSKLIDALD